MSKQNRPTIKTRAEMERVVETIMTATLGLARLSSEMDARLAAIRNEYADPLSSAKSTLAINMDVAEDWAKAHPEEFPVGKKSIEMTHGVIGFRTGTPKLKLLSRETWEKVLDRLKKYQVDYTRTSITPDKEALIADREKLGEAVLRDFGLKVVQDETFYVEPKRETSDPSVAKGG